MRFLALLLLAAAPAWTQTAWAQPARAQPGPSLRLELAGPETPALLDTPACGGRDWPDAPARAVRVHGETWLFSADPVNRVNAGPDLLHLRHRCAVVFEGAGNDDPAAFDDQTWIASIWTPDGRTVHAVLHNEFQGHRRRALCPTGRYMDCWHNTLTAAVSDGGPFRRLPGTVAVLPYRFGETGLGHKGYFNPSNIVTHEGAQFMFAFATQAGAQAPGNCLLRTTRVADPAAWRAWGGDGFTVAFANPYAGPVTPERHVCTPVGAGSLRWPVTSLVRHAATGTFLAIMHNAARGGGVHYATSPDLLHWSAPAALMPGAGPGGFQCGDPPPMFYPSLLDPGSPDRNFETVGSTGQLFATRFGVTNCRPGPERNLVRWLVRISAP